MRKLNVSAITNTVGMPEKSGTLLHIQLAYQEALSALGAALAGSAYNPTKVYVLTGCVNSGSGSNYNISAGSVFYNGEVYLVDASAFTISGPNVAVGIVPAGAVTTGLTYYSDVIADPVQFTDGVNRNVHEIRKCVLQAGLSGSGAANYNDWIDITKRIQGNIGDIKIWRFKTGVLSDYFDATTGAGIHPYTAGWQICNGQNGSVDLRGRTPFGYNPSDSDFNNPFNNVGGSKTHTLTMSELPAQGVGYRDRYWSEAGGTVGSAPFKEQQPNSGNYNGRWGASNSDQDNDTFLYLDSTTNPLGSGDAHAIMPPYRSVLWVERIN